MMPLDNIRKQFGVELGFVILIVRVYFKKAESNALSDYLEKYAINWPYLNELIYAHELRPIVYKVLSVHSIAVDTLFLLNLKSQCLYVARNNLEKLKEQIRLQALFDQSKIPTVPIKGVLLSHFLYDDFVTRETCDIDFLVYPANTSQVAIYMQAEGYESDFYLNENDEEYLVNISCERAFYKETECTRHSVEFHWQLLLPTFDVPLKVQEVFQHVERRQFVGKEIPCLNTEYTLLTMLTHHGVNDVWRTLKHVVDLTAFLEKHTEHINWPAFEEKIKKYRMHYSTQVGMRLVNDLFGTSIPALCMSRENKTMERVLQNLLRYPMLNKFKYSRENFLQHLNMRDNIVDKARFFLNTLKLLFAPTANDLRSLKLPKPLFFAYYIIKPFRLINDHRKSKNLALPL